MSGIFALALGGSPDREAVGSGATESSSSSAADTAGARDSGSASSSGSSSSGSDPETTGSNGDSTGEIASSSGMGETMDVGPIDACEMPDGPDGWPPDDDSCPFELEDPCGLVRFTTNGSGDLEVEEPNAAFCMLDWLDSSAPVALSFERQIRDRTLWQRVDMWLLDDGTAVVDIDGWMDKANLGALPRRFMRPASELFDGCSALGPGQELYDCLWWWEDEPCIGTPSECDQAL